mgnify:CR=1 FL=1
MCHPGEPLRRLLLGGTLLVFVDYCLVPLSNIHLASSYPSLNSNEYERSVIIEIVSGYLGHLFPSVVVGLVFQ